MPFGTCVGCDDELYSYYECNSYYCASQEPVSGKCPDMPATDLQPQAIRPRRLQFKGK